MNRPTAKVTLLLLANALALGAVLLTWPSPADAQVGAAGGQVVKPLDARARGDYAMVEGRISSGGNHVIYVIDSANQEMIALRWDSSKQIFVGVGYRSLAIDGRGARGR